MWSTEVKRTTTAPKEKIWQLYEDVANWKNWDAEIDYSEIFGAFQAGTKGVLKPKGGPKVKFVILKTEKNVGFTDRSFLPLCKMEFSHHIKETKGGLELTHRVEMSGLMTFLFKHVVGKNIAAGLPQSVENLIALAQNK